MESELIKYIRSGEFTFCSRCGKVCRVGSDEFMCTKCTNSLFSKKESPLEFDERIALQEHEARVGSSTREYREELANIRKEEEERCLEIQLK